MRGRSHLWRVNKPPPHPHPPPRTSKLPHHPLSEDGEQTGVKKIAFPTPLSGVSCQVYRSFVSLCFDEQPVLMDKENRGTVGSPQRVRGECVRWGCCKWCSASDTWMGSMCTVTAAGTPVLIWRDASLMSWKLGYLFFLKIFVCKFYFFPPPQTETEKNPTCSLRLLSQIWERGWGGLFVALKCVKCGLLQNVTDSHGHAPHPHLLMSTDLNFIPLLKASSSGCNRGN